MQVVPVGGSEFVEQQFMLDPMSTGINVYRILLWTKCLVVRTEWQQHMFYFGFIARLLWLVNQNVEMVFPLSSKAPNSILLDHVDHKIVYVRWILQDHRLNGGKFCKTE